MRGLRNDVHIALRCLDGRGGDLPAALVHSDPAELKNTQLCLAFRACFRYLLAGMFAHACARIFIHSSLWRRSRSCALHVRSRSALGLHPFGTGCACDGLGARGLGVRAVGSLCGLDMRIM